MNEISKIKLDNGDVFDIKDSELREALEILLQNMPEKYKKEKENSEK